MVFECLARSFADSGGFKVVTMDSNGDPVSWWRKKQSKHPQNPLKPLKQRNPLLFCPSIWLLYYTKHLYFYQTIAELQFESSLSTLSRKTHQQTKQTNHLRGMAYWPLLATVGHHTFYLWESQSKHITYRGNIYNIMFNSVTKACR